MMILELTSDKRGQEAGYRGLGTKKHSKINVDFIDFILCSSGVEQFL